MKATFAAQVLAVLSLMAGPSAHDVPAASAASGNGPTRPNILFILCDDLGINDLHCYGRQDHHTPNLDHLAEQGLRFTSAYCAQPICSPSRAAILTGKAPARLHLTTFLPGRPNAASQKVLHPEIEMQVPLNEKMICNYLKEAGYATAAIGKWHVGGAKFGPVEHGFDMYHAGKANTKPSASEGGKGEYDLTATAEKFIEEHKDGPFFVYLAHNTPHIPYDAQPRRIHNNAQAFEPVYAGVVETLDDTVGRLMAKLDALKLADKTIVVFTSDNGGLHVPEGPHPRVTHNTPYRAGKGFVYEGGLRIPLIVRWPGHVPAGKVAGDPVINTDWVPTLLDLIGQPVPAGLDGLSIAALLTGRGPAPERKLFWHFPHYTNQGSRPSGAVRDGNWMMVEYYDDAKVELYDLRKDMGEAQDVAELQPERASQMRAALAAWRKEIKAQENSPNPDFDPAKYRRLYVDVDASRFDPAQADQAQWEKMWKWRKEMNAAVAGAERDKGGRSKKQHFIFAHYMVCFAAYGERVEDYKREIQAAQAAGIDGFALNCGAWHNEPHYPRRTQAIYQAAQELGTGFKLFFSVDFAGLKRHPPGEFESYVLDMVKTYGHHPNQFMVHGRTVVSTFTGEQGIAWKKDILAPLKAAGYEVFLVPFFYPRPRVSELPDEAAVKEHYRKWADIVDGMFYFGAAGTAEALAASNAAYAKVMREAGKVCMCSFTPMYWGASQPDRRYFETCGGEGIEVQWKSIIAEQPDWVEIVTWNDFNESYICPIAAPNSPDGRASPRAVPACLKSRSSHAGYLELSRYYMEWYKTGKQPSLKDGLFYFYRLHPKDAVAKDDRPVKALHGPVEDVLYVTTTMTAVAELLVTSGGAKSMHPLKAGIQHFRIPFGCGPQHFAVYRDGKAILAKDGEAITDRIERYDYFPASGFVYGQAPSRRAE